jgi:hypothetical protein
MFYKELYLGFPNGPLRTFLCCVFYSDLVPRFSLQRSDNGDSQQRGNGELP